MGNRAFLEKVTLRIVRGDFGDVGVFRREHALALSTPLLTSHDGEQATTFPSTQGFEFITVIRRDRYEQPWWLRGDQRLEGWLESEGISYDYVTIEKEKAPDTFLKSLSRRQRQGFIFPGPAASFFGLRAPESLCHIFRQHRVALMDGPLSLPFATVPAVRADIAATDWRSVTSAITEDFLTMDAFADSKTTVFEAKPYLQAPLSQFAQTI